jgi:YhcH/YjgK/YiaL family protein
MIIDTIENAYLYANLSDGIARGLEVLKDTGIGQKPDGRCDIDGDDLYYVVQHYTTKPFDEGKLEAHRKYIDIQFITSGAESIGVATLDDFAVAEPYNEETDAIFYEPPTDIDRITLRPGMFCMFFPQDGHMPCRELDGPEEVCKIVVKILIDL